MSSGRGTNLALDRYLGYGELTDYVKGVVESYPGLASLHSVGKSYEGRDIWAVTLTNSATGSHDEKPAIYVDGNIHAGEVTGSMVALCLIGHLVENYGKDEETTHLMDTRTFYILPRVNPDGAELYLTTPSQLRSSVRVWPEDQEENPPGLRREDLDGDGLIRQMRVRDDDCGEWRISGKDRRLMLPRRPGDRVGPFYRIYPEGVIEEYEGGTVSVGRSPFGLDLNRNFPSNWDTAVNGGGDYPGSEPESRTIIDFIQKHPNIGAVQALHTTGGFFYRNPCQYPDDKMDAQDFKATREIAAVGFARTGYPDVKSPNRATLTEWAYEHRGVIAYTTELWDRMGRAGIDHAERRASDPAKREEQGCKLLSWSDRELAGKGFKDWTPFDHPQLGQVEIGGWDPKYCLQNAPPSLLAQECHKNALWIMAHAASLPLVRPHSITVEDVQGQVRKVTASFKNVGYLGTSVTNKAKELGVVKPDTVEILPGPGVTVLGKAKQETGFLDGYIGGSERGGAAKSVARATWMVKLDPEVDLTLQVVYKSRRGGTARLQYP